MGWRGLGVTVVLALVGALVGGGIARVVRDEPARLDESQPVAAVSPSFPTDPPIEVLPDPSTPPLATDLPTHQATVGQEPFDLNLPVPNGWTRSNPNATEWRWFVEGHPNNTYVLRVVLPSGYATIEAARQDRIAALDGATGIQEFDLEDETADGFTATYVLDSYRRLTMERFLALDGSTTVNAVVAIIGREADREGMTDLIDTIAAEATR